MKHIILIGHKKRMGKDTFASMLAKLIGGKIIRFADPMKQIIADTFNIPIIHLEDWKNEGDELMHTTGYPQTYRDILQRFGSEAMKKQFGEEIWADLATERIWDAAKTNDVIIVPDFRFTPELESIRWAFHNKNTKIVTINIIRPGIETDDKHASETSLDSYKYDHVINNNGQVTDLELDVVKFAINMGILKATHE